MRVFSRIIWGMILPLLVLGASLPLVGCDGQGFDVNLKIDSGDNPTPPAGPPGGGDGGGTPPPNDTNRFTGLWIAAYGDDQSGIGTKQYSVRLDLAQNNRAITGTGRMFRVFNTGLTSNDTVELQVSGTASNDDAQVTLKSKGSVQFTYAPLWHLRAAGDQMTGIYEETDTNGALVVSGHALWRRVKSGSMNDSWVSGYTDAFAATGLKSNDTTGVVTLARAEDNSLSGDGVLLVQRETDVPDARDFSVTRGVVSGSQLDFTFGDLALAETEMDWFCFSTADLFVGAYGQFVTDAGTGDQNLNRFGHAAWHRSANVAPESVSRKWVTAFRDSATAGAAQLGDYLIQASLQVQNGGGISGSAQVLDEREDTPQFRSFTVSNGAVTGSRVQFELIGPTTTFAWELRTTGAILVGSYERFTSGGAFLSRGIAEWRAGGTNDLRGLWTTAYADTYRASDPEVTQLSVITITGQTDSGVLSGTGTLQFAGENSRRTFRMTGVRNGEQVDWTWQGGTGTTGDTIWHLRQTGEILHGTYSNYTSADTVESRGDAMWFRTSRTVTAQ